MKILLVNLPWERGGQWGVRAGSRWPHIKTVHEKGYLPFPFFLAYAAALLQREGFDVKVIDSLALEMRLDPFLRAVDAENPDLLVAETSTPSLFNDLSILKRMRRDLPVALCGPESSIALPQFLEHHTFIQYVFSGEYEWTLLELARRLQARKSLVGLQGLIWRDASGVKTGGPRPLLDNLDDLPWPMRDGLPMHKYNDTPGGIPSPSVQMWSSRGCPYHCLFCIWPQLMYQSHRYRTRGLLSVVDEMEYLVHEKGFKSIYFDDDTMNIGKLRMMELANEIRRRGLSVPWAMMARADLMEEDILENLRGAGLTAIKYGVESSSQELLDNIHKGMNLRKVERMIRATKALGIRTHLTFTFGLPGESFDTIQRTIDFAKDLDPDSLQFSITTAFPGTKYFQHLEERGHIVSRDFVDYDGSFKAMLRTDHLKARDLVRAKRRADQIWSDHVWRTRPHPIGLRDYWEKFLRRAQGYVFRLGGLRLPPWVHRQAEKIRIYADLGFLKDSAVMRSWRSWAASWAIYAQRVRKNCLNIIGIYHGSYAFKGPDCVQIDLTSDCNNNCVSCWCNSPFLREKAYKGAKKYKTLPTQLVLSVIDELAGLGTTELYFSGGGEPFMHPDILEILEHAKKRGMYCCVNTNFTLVDEKVIGRLIDLSVDALTVSVWAGTPRAYAVTHPNKDEATFYKIKDTLKMLNSLKGRGRSPRIKVYNVISNLNYDELEKMVDFAEETGSESLEFTVVDTIPGATDQLVLTEEQRRSLLEQCDRIRTRATQTQVLGLENFTRRLSDAGASQAEYDRGFLGASPCYVGWVFSRIMSDGDVNFCLKAHRIPVGNLYQNSFHEIWNSAKQQEFRKKTLRFDVNDPFFRLIGNDESCSMGCYKSCDDLGRNIAVRDRLNALSPLQRGILKAVSRVVRCPQAK